MTVREFRLGKGKKVQVWKIWQDGEHLWTEHGQENGKMQTFSDRPGDKGKPGTKAYVDAVANASFHIEREVRKKTEHGYIEYINGKPTEEQVTEIVFNKALPKNFCGYKPQTDIKPEALVKLHKTGKARYTRKMDGMCTLAVHHPTGWEFYTRRMDLTTERFPLHVEELNKSKFEVGTILVGEAVCVNESGKEDFKAISSFYRSLPEESRKIVEAGEVPEPVFVIFDILFHNGKALNNVNYDNRAKLYRNDFAPFEEKKGLVASIDHYVVNPDTWDAVAKENTWEGFVVTDGDGVPGDKFFSFDGSAQRPKGHHKLKPLWEDDVVVYAAASGSGKRLNGIGALFVKQKHPETGKYFNCGKVGSGMTDSDLEELETLCKENNIPIFDKDKDAESVDLQNDEGLVAMLEYGERQPGTNKFRFPVFCRIRTDKAPHECVAQRLAPEEE